MAFSSYGSIDAVVKKYHLRYAEDRVIVPAADAPRAGRVGPPGGPLIHGRPADLVPLGHPGGRLPGVEVEQGQGPAGFPGVAAGPGQGGEHLPVPSGESDSGHGCPSPART